MSAKRVVMGSWTFHLLHHPRRRRPVAGALPLRGEASSSVCGTAIMDSLTTTNMGVQAVGSSLATALRDRQAYVIPIQPNRSLPVRPAPHHTPCRTAIVRSSFSRPPPFVITTQQPLVTDEPRKCDTASKVIEVPSEKSDKLPDETSETLLKASDSKKEVEDKNSNKKSSESGKDPSSEMKKSYARDIHSFGTTSDNHLIDLSHSPERIDVDLESDEVTIYSTTNSGISQGCWNREIISKDKGKRHKKGFKRTSEESRENYLSHTTKTGCKTVPPIRLKKIQTLQEPVTSLGHSWQGIAREIDESTFTINAGSMNSNNAKRLKNTDSYKFAGGNEYSSKYRIVTGDSPTYEDCADPSPTTESQYASLDAAKLRYRQSKLKVRIQELRRKKVNLGKQMLRIESLEKFLNVLPNSSGCGDEIEEIQWQNYGNTTKVIDEPEVEESLVISPTRTRSSSTSSSMCSSPSLEPPKLSPRSPTNYEAAKSPSEMRNSPPVLPRVYVTITDCREYTWDGRKNSSRRGRVKRRYRSPEKKEVATESPVISTTTATDIKDKTEHIDGWENLNSTNENFSEIGKIDISTDCRNSVDILEIYGDSKCPNEKKDCMKNGDEIESTAKLSSNLQSADIDTIDGDTDFEVKPHFVEDISEIPINDVTDSESTSINSTCEIVHEENSIAKRKVEERKDIVTVSEEVAEEQQNGNRLTIDEQFPTLGNWIARLSKKQVAVTGADAVLNESTAVENRNDSFQQLLNTSTDKSVTPEVLQNNTPIVPHDNVSTPHWRNDRWQEQQEQQQNMSQSYAPILPLLPPPHPPPLDQEFCSPIAMARLYTRNYAIDPYSVAYGYNPTIATAAATTSIWNSAAILQCPLLRPSATMLNSRMQSSNLSIPSGTVPQRPIYRGMQQSPVVKRPTLENSIINYGQRDSKLMNRGTSTPYDRQKRANSEGQQALAVGQTRLTFNSANGQSINYRSCHQQQQQQQPQMQQPQDQQRFARSAYANSAMRFPVGGAAWRASGHVIGTMGTGYNYSGTSGWSTPSGNILNSFSRTSTNGFPSPPSVISMNPSRTRNVKETVEWNSRNCETPHLGKVVYKPNTVSNLVCSNCCATGPMFKCLGCEVAFYCDENCQARHWNHHVISCPKKMPKLKKLVH